MMIGLYGWQIFAEIPSFAFVSATYQFVYEQKFQWLSHHKFMYIICHIVVQYVNLNQMIVLFFHVVKDL